MPAKDLYRLILQNVRTLDPNDAIFELTQLRKMTQINFDKEIDLLSDPDVTGKPNVLKEVNAMITKQFTAWQKQNQ
ncbi:MAG: hypothetical protein AJITA_00934 [Acetilactobacillus jinshanensis]